MKKKVLAIVLATSLALSLGLASAALAAWQEGGGTDWYYVDASYGGYHNSVGLDIQLDGDSSAGQIFYVGDTITISGYLHAVAQSCGGDGNGAYTEWLLEIDGPSGPDSTSGWNYDHSSGCAIADIDTTLSITYNVTAPGTHTVYMSSYAAVSQYWTDVADDFVDASLTFEVPIEVEIDVKPCSDPNSINLKSKGVVPVAVLTTDDFDASDVDPTTVEFAGAEPVRWTVEDVCPTDGQDDLLLFFKTQELDLDEDSTDATLTGYTYDGLNRLIGKDAVNIVPKKGK